MPIGAADGHNSRRILGLTEQSPELRTLVTRVSSVAATSGAVAFLALAAEAGLSAPLSLVVAVVPALFAFIQLDRFSQKPTSRSVADAKKSVKRLLHHYDSLAESHCVDAPSIAPHMALGPYPANIDDTINIADFLESSDVRADELLISRLYRENMRCIILLGNPGAGKSVLMLKLASSIARDFLDKSAPHVPLILPLRDWCPDLSFSEWISEQASYLYAIPPSVTRCWLIDGSPILLLDGYDEVPALERENLLRDINRWRMTSSSARIVISCRSSDPGLSRLASVINADQVAVIQCFPKKQMMDYLESAMGSINAVRDASRYRPDVGRSARILREFMQDDDIREKLMLGLVAASRAEAATRKAEERTVQEGVDPIIPALTVGNQLYAAGNYDGAKIAYLEASRVSRSSKHAIAILLYGVCEAVLNNKPAAREAVYQYVASSFHDSITPSEAGNRVRLGTQDEHRVLGAMQQGISYDICQVCSRSSLSPSRAYAALHALHAIGAVDTPLERLDGVRYRRSDAFTVDGG